MAETPCAATVSIPKGGRHGIRAQMGPSSTLTRDRRISCPVSSREGRSAHQARVRWPAPR
jgi:hypothetical protein